MSKIKSKGIGIVVVLLIALNSYGQDNISFFQAKSEIAFEKNGEKERFTVHIRYDLKDTLWLSFTGALGIEGARMLITPDSTYLINKFAKTHEVFSTVDGSPLFPFSFTLDDWKLMLLNIPYRIDSSTNQTTENDLEIESHYTYERTKKIFYKNKRIIKCELNEQRTGVQCEMMYTDYDVNNKSWPLAQSRSLVIKGENTSTVNISIKYVDYKYNNPKPFIFNFAKFKHEAN